MAFFLDMVALAGGLLFGGLGGYALGARWRDNHRILWPVAITAFLAASLLNFVGRVIGLEWLSIGSIGLMAGVTSGIKYGGFPDVRVWEKRPPHAEVKPAEDVDESTSKDTDGAPPIDADGAPPIDTDGAPPVDNETERFEHAEEDGPDGATEHSVVQAGE